jgi:hypothetical protein
MAMPKNQSEWKELVVIQQQGRVPISTFCLEHHITPSQFYYYQGKFFPRNKIEGKLIPVKINKETIPKGPNQFLRISKGSLILEIPLDYSIEDIGKLLSCL